MSAVPVPEFSFPVDVTGLPPLGRRYSISADGHQREKVATRLGVQEIAALAASFELVPRAGGIVDVTGTVEASLTQTCVVTLAPLAASVKEQVAAKFATIAPVVKAGKADKTEEELVALSDEDPPEEAYDGQIDLGELAVVHLALGLDPYPRAPGVAFQEPAWTEKPEENEAANPFAVLAKLKKNNPADRGD